MGFAARLRQERLRRHLSQEALAEALGVSARTISRWEQGRGTPQAILRVQLSQYFGITPEAFFDESETSLPPEHNSEKPPAEELNTLALAEPDSGNPAADESEAIALAEQDSGNPAASVGLRQDGKVSGKSTPQRLFHRRTILLSGGVLGLILLTLSLIVLSASVLKGMTPMVTASPTALPSVPIGSTAVATNNGTSSTNNNRGTYICWGARVHLPAQCMDLKGDRFRANQPIDLWSSRSGNGLGWNIAMQGKVTSTWPFTVASLNTKYYSDTVASFEKTTGAGHDGCIGVNPNAGLAWEPCGRSDTYWVISTYGYLVNVSHSNSIGAPAAAGVCDARNGGSIGLGVENQPNHCLGPWTLI